MLLTVVVPVHNVEAYLEQCLASLLDHDPPAGLDLEVVAVDDASPDGSGAILDAWAQRHPRLRVLHLEHNVGLGPARNAGLSHARGDYVLFLDSDDWLATGALPAIADALATWPELLIVDYQRVWGEGTPDRRVVRNATHGILEGLEGRAFVVRDHPEVLQTLHVAWNKVCRRELLDREGLTFPPGYYEDTAWTHQVWFTARSVRTLGQVVVCYRQRPESILGSCSPRHFEVFDQWERLLEWLDAHPEHEHWRREVVARMIRHYQTLLVMDRRLAPGDRATFLARVRQHVHHRGGRAAAYASTPKERVFHRLVDRGDLRLLDATVAAYRAGRAARITLGAARRGLSAGRRVPGRLRQ